jgi:hypothetical protein
MPPSKRGYSHKHFLWSDNPEHGGRFWHSEYDVPGPSAPPQFTGCSCAANPDDRQDYGSEDSDANWR